MSGEEHGLVAWGVLRRLEGSDPGDAGQSFPEEIWLRHEAEVFGRVPKAKRRAGSVGCHRLNRAQISGTHCELRVDATGAVQLTDSSSNGTYVNDTLRRLAKGSSRGVQHDDKVYLYVNALDATIFLGYRLELVEAGLTPEAAARRADPPQAAARSPLRSPQTPGRLSDGRRGSQLSGPTSEVDPSPAANRAAGGDGVLEALHAEQKEILGNLERQKQALLDENAELRAARASLEARLEAEAHASQGAERAATEARASAAAARAETEALRAQVVELEAQKAAAEAARNASGRRLDEAGLRTTDLESQLRSSQARAADAAAQIATFEAKLGVQDQVRASEKDTGTDLRSQVRDLQRDVRLETAKSRSLAERAEAAEADLARTQKMLGSVAELEEALRTARELARSRFEELERVKGDLEDALVRAAEAQEAPANQLHLLAAEADAQAFQTKAQHLVERADALEAEVLEKNRQLQTVAQRSAALQDDKVASDSRLATLQRDLEAAKRVAEGLQSKEETLGREVALQKERVAALEAQVGRARAEANAMVAQLRRAEARQDRRTAGLNAVQKLVHAMLDAAGPDLVEAAELKPAHMEWVGTQMELLGKGKREGGGDGMEGLPSFGTFAPLGVGGHGGNATVPAHGFGGGGVGAGAGGNGGRIAGDGGHQAGDHGGDPCEAGEQVRGEDGIGNVTHAAPEIGKDASRAADAIPPGAEVPAAAEDQLPSRTCSAVEEVTEALELAPPHTVATDLETTEKERSSSLGKRGRDGDAATVPATMFEEGVGPSPKKARSDASEGRPCGEALPGMAVQDQDVDDDDGEDEDEDDEVIVASEAFYDPLMEGPNTDLSSGKARTGSDSENAENAENADPNSLPRSPAFGADKGQIEGAARLGEPACESPASHAARQLFSPLGEKVAATSSPRLDLVSAAAAMAAEMEEDDDEVLA